MSTVIVKKECRHPTTGVALKPGQSVSVPAIAATLMARQGLVTFPQSESPKREPAGGEEALRRRIATLERENTELRELLVAADAEVKEAQSKLAVDNDNTDEPVND